MVDKHDLITAIDSAPDVCAREPIHLSGAIQPHGMLVGLDGTTLALAIKSANVDRLFPGTRFGKPPRWLPATVIAACRALDPMVLPESSLITELEGVGLTEMHCYLGDGAVFCEFEWNPPPTPASSASEISLRVTHALTAMNEVDEVAGLSAVLTKAVRQISGYERVIVYRFDADHHGEAIGESIVDDGPPSFLGLHFPASDIPAQARALYQRSLERWMPTRDYEPVPLDSPADQPIDLTLCRYRDVSPTHRMYQHNIGVDGAMSLSILHDGELWGLLIGHHRRPHRASLAIRHAVGKLVKAYAMRLDSIISRRATTEIECITQAYSALLRKLAAADDFLPVLMVGSPTVLELLPGCSGAAVVWDGDSSMESLVIGCVPPVEDLQALVAWMRCAIPTMVYATDQLPEEFVPFRTHRSLAAGVLAIRFADPRRPMLLMFRPEEVQQVGWAGKPEKRSGPDGVPNLPRRSFERWNEIRRGRSSPWNPWEVEIAQTLCVTVNDVIVRQTRRVQELAINEARLLRLQMLYAAIIDMGRLIVSKPDLTGLFRGVCKLAVETGNFTMAWIGVPDETDGHIMPLARYGEGIHYLDEAKISIRADIPEGQGPIGLAFREDRTVLVEDFSHDPLTHPWHALGRKFGWTGSATFCIRRDAKPYGILAVYSRDKEVLDGEVIILLERLAIDIGHAMDSMERERQQREWRQLSAALDAEQRQHAQQYKTIIQASLDGFCITDDAAHILDANESICRMLGYHREEILGLPIADIAVDADGWLAAAAGHAVPADRQSLFETVYKRKDGKLIDVEVRIVRVSSLGDRLYSFARDITERKRSQQALQIAATAFAGSQEGMMVTDPEALILQVNPAFTAITGYSAEEAVGRTADILSSGHHDAAFFSALWDSLAAKGAWQGEIWDRRKSGEIYPQWLTINAVKDHEGKAINFVATLTDITERKAAENEIEHLAFYDPLTRLPNRRLLLDRLRHALTAGTRSGHEGALLFIDLDDFKTLNDTLGHDVGDQLLRQVAERLSTCVREGDTVARLGGDEFVVMLEGLDERAEEAAGQTEMVGVKILATLNQPYQLGDHRHYSTASIGVTLFQDHGDTVEDLLKRADIAMYQAKASGRNAVRFYDPAMQAAVAARIALEEDLRQAIRDNQLMLVYQPQVDDDGVCAGAEALVRWRHPRRGLVSPGEFIPLAEESGLILPLGQWVLETACRQLVAWASHPVMSGLSIAVNVSARQFHLEDFVRQVLAVIQATGADPHKLKLELTESMLLDNVEDIIEKMTALKEQGIRFSLDDFGTGYSSLSYLKRLPLSQLKIDQSFVRDVLEDTNDAAIARTIITLGQSLGLAVIAEGVETEGQRAFLANHGCTAYQGYLFGRPLPADDLESWHGRPTQGG